MKMSSDNLSLLILCGGMGSRMRGQDKPLIPYSGTPMLDLVVASASDLPLLISANRNLDEYEKRGRTFTDREVGTDLATPLNGVLGGLERASTDWLLVSPGDSPCLPVSWWHLLAEQLLEADAGVVAHDGQRQQNLHMILRTSLGPKLRVFIQEGHGEVWRFLETAGIRSVDVPKPDWFLNVNEVGDLVT
ncbi:MAG: NTP transferase domain-containing protein [Pseudomonadales bacterium]|nr:NTP transferase domain-containing protein [Pseudomonadales bacterium]